MGSLKSPLRSLLAAVLLLAALQAQQPPHVVKGKATDEHGQPLAGVEVRLLIKWSGSESICANAALQTAPLPKGRSDADGNWVLAILWPLTAIASDNQAMFVLEARFAGRQPWRELVSPPLHLWNGDDLALPPLREADLATVAVADPQPGMLLCVERVGNPTRYEDGPPRPETQILEVPSDGRVQVHVPLLPNPVAPVSFPMVRPLGWQVRLVAPGRSSAPLAIAPGEVVAFATPRQAPPSRPVERSDHQPLRSLRVLLQVADDDLRWLPVAGAAVPVDEVLPVRAVVADGCAAIPFGGTLVLSPLADAPRTVRVASPTGEPLRDFEALWSPLPQALTVLPHELLRSGQLLRCIGDAVELPGADAAPGLLQLRAKGCATARAFDPRSRIDPAVLHLDAEAQTTLVLKVVDDDDHPVPGALVQVWSFANGASQSWQPLGRAPAVTAADGTLRCEGVPVGDNLSLEATAAGFLGDPAHAVEAPLQEQEFTLRLHRLATHRLRTVDADGEVVPFAAVGFESMQETGSGGTAGTFSALLANARGELVLQLPPDQQPRLVQGRFGNFAEPWRRQQQRARAGELVVARWPLLALRVPDTGPWLVSTLAWQRVQAGSAFGSNEQLPKNTCALLLPWPLDLLSWRVDVRNGPAFVVSRDDLAGRGPLVELDRRAVTRRLPLRLSGDVPASLHGLHAGPRWSRDQWAKPFHADAIGSATDGSPLLLARDDHEHLLWLCHPDCLQVALVLPAAAAGATEVVADLRRGAPVTFTVTLKQPLHETEQLMVSAITTGLIGREVGSCALRDPALRAVKVGQPVTLRAPFALPPGRLRLQLSSSMRSTTSSPVEVTGTAPVSIDFGEW